ncbi:MAG TPA: DUF4253 domain-containing protein [Verrucomicrobiae bacterium]
MSISADIFEPLRQAGTNGANFDLDTEAVIKHLQHWQTLCQFTLAKATGDSVYLNFQTLPADMTAFARDVYAFCPDLVDQGTGCVHEMVESMADMGEPISPAMQKLIEGVDFSDPEYGLEILKREIIMKKSLTLWWD